MGRRDRSVSRSRSRSPSKSKKSKKSKKSSSSSRRRSRSRSRDRRRSRSRSRERTSRRRRSRSRSRSPKSKKSSRRKRSRDSSRRRRDRSRDRRRDRSSSSDSSRSSRSTSSRSTSSSKASRRGPAKSAKESAFDAQNKAMAQALKADAASATTPQQDEVAKIKRDRQIIDLESGTFEPKSFTSSRKAPVASGATHHNDEAPVIVDTFAFGTAAERQADDKVTIASMSRNQLIEEKLKTEGLCHPNLYPDAQEKEKEWIKYLTNLRKELSQKS